LSPEQVGFTAVPAYKGNAVALASSMPFSISQYSKNQEAAWEFLKWLSNPDLEKRNAIERTVAGQAIQNNVVNHTANLIDEEVNKANAGVPAAGYGGLKNARVQPKLREWPEVGDLLAAAIQRAAGGEDVERLMNDSAKAATKVLE